jgi:hypothetical protein
MQTAVTSPTSNQLEIHAILEPGEMQRLVDAIDEVTLLSFSQTSFSAHNFDV